MVCPWYFLYTETMAENKTQKNSASVTKFLDTIADEQQRKDSYEILAMMEKATKAKPVMWGTSIIGFGDYHYKYASGREGDWFVVGFSPRKGKISIYFCLCDLSAMTGELEGLGKYTIGKSCLYIKTLDDIDRKHLTKMIKKFAKEQK